MPLMETVTIINKSGKVVSTGKHLVNIFKDAKEAYNEKKAEMRGEHQKRIAYKSPQKLIQAREETQSVASSRHSRRSRSSRHRHTDNAGPSRPPLTARNLSQISEGSVTSSRRSRSHHGSRMPQSPPGYEPPFFESEDVEGPGPGITRRHTDFPEASQVSRRTLPPPYSLHRSISNPDFSENIDMNLAYGELPYLPSSPIEQEQEVQATMSKLDALLTEAQCLQHSVTTIITNLQANPEAMAAVALTLAELSNLLTKMSPSILTALKTASPAVFGLLASPQFLIAGGVAMGVTVVMFGGFKIVKQIQANNEMRKEANRMEEAMVYGGLEMGSRMEEAMVYDGLEMGSIESWRRGIENIEGGSVVSTSVDGELISPEAARRKKEHIRDRAKEERKKGKSRRAESVVSGTTERTVRRVGSEGTIRSESTVKQRDIPIRSSSSRALTVPSESGRSERSTRSRKESKGKELVVSADKEKKSVLSNFLKKHKEKGKAKAKEGSERSHSRSHRPKMIEM